MASITTFNIKKIEFMKFKKLDFGVLEIETDDAKISLHVKSTNFDDTLLLFMHANIRHMDIEEEERNERMRAREQETAERATVPTTEENEVVVEDDGQPTEEKELQDLEGEDLPAEEPQIDDDICPRS